MASFSLGTVWEETIAFLRREGHLLVPVALALFGPAQVLITMAMGTGAAPAKPGPHSFLILPGLLLILYGNLAVTRLVLVPGASVGESLSGSLRRLPLALAATMLISLALLAVLVVILLAATLGAQTSGADVKAAGTANQLSLLLMIPAVFLLIRLLMLMPVLAMEQHGAVDTIRRSWNLGRGHGLRFLGVFALSILLNALVAIINLVVFGSLAGLLRMVMGAELVGALQLIVAAALSALLMLGFTVYVALVYRKLSAG